MKEYANERDYTEINCFIAFFYHMADLIIIINIEVET